MNILCTFPGRHGDILWALPTVRAICEHYGEAVDLQIAGEFAGLKPLLTPQPYIGQVIADDHWALVPPEEWRAPFTAYYDAVYHLGYRGWPQEPLAQATYRVAIADYGLPLPPLDLARSWIHDDAPWTPAVEVIAGFADTHFELKIGLLAMLRESPRWSMLLLTPANGGGRWGSETPRCVSSRSCGWAEATRHIRHATVFLGDCSALHVLAVAVGTPVVLVEPMEARWNPIFYPLGMDGMVKVVKGNDGRPTYDARHVADALRAGLGR